LSAADNSLERRPDADCAHEPTNESPGEARTIRDILGNQPQGLLDMYKLINHSSWSLQSPLTEIYSTLQ